MNSVDMWKQLKKLKKNRKKHNVEYFLNCMIIYIHKDWRNVFGYTTWDKKLLFARISE